MSSKVKHGLGGQFEISNCHKLEYVMFNVDFRGKIISEIVIQMFYKTSTKCNHHGIHLDLRSCSCEIGNSNHVKSSLNLFFRLRRHETTCPRGLAVTCSLLELSCPHNLWKFLYLTTMLSMQVKIMTWDTLLKVRKSFKK